MFWGRAGKGLIFIRRKEVLSEPLPHPTPSPGFGKLKALGLYKLLCQEGLLAEEDLGRALQGE